MKILSNRPKSETSVPDGNGGWVTEAAPRKAREDMAERKKMLKSRRVATLGDLEKLREELSLSRGRSSAQSGQ